MNVKFDNTTLNNYFWITNLQGLGMPTTRDHDYEYINTNGSYFDGVNLETRVITLTCTMMSDISKSVYQKLDEIKNVVAPWKGEKKIELSCYPDRYIMGRFSGQMDIEQIVHIQNFPLSFKCSDPLFYENTQNTINGTSGTLNNKGNWLTQDIIISVSVLGNGTLTITNSTTGKSLVFKNTDTGTAAMVIDFKNATAMNASKTVSYMKYYQSGEFFNLVPGNNNLTITGSTGTPSIKWRSAWV